MFLSTSSLTGSQTYASCMKYVGRGSSPARSADARLASPGAARPSQTGRMPPPPPRAPPLTPIPSTALFAPAFAAAPSRVAPAFGAISGRGSHTSDEHGADVLFGVHAAHSSVAAPAAPPAANASSSRRAAPPAAPPHALSAQSGPCPTIALASGLKALKEDVAHLREQHHEAVELASKRHRELEQAIEHERDEKRARIASTAALAREVESLSARFSSLAAAHAAQATHVAALQAALEAGRQEAAPTETGFFDLFFDGDGAERLGETLGLETLADEGTPADVSTAACPNANGGLPPDEDDDNDTDEPSAFEPALEPVSPSKTAARFAPIAHAAREAGSTSAPPAVWRLTPVARDYAPVTPAAKPRDTETAPPDAGAYRLRSGTKRAVGSDSQSDSARRRLFDCDFSRGGGGYNVAEDLFDNAMSQ